jgi:hybrid cluster-associated redox disulfide protein
MADMTAITKDMTIMEVVNQHPQSIKVFYEHGLFCIGCNVAYRETVEQGAAAHGIEVGPLIEKLNQAVAGKPQGS